MALLDDNIDALEVTPKEGIKLSKTFHRAFGCQDDSYDTWNDHINSATHWIKINK